MKNWIRFALAVAVLFATTLAPAASSASKADKVAQGFLKLKDSVTKAQTQVDSVLASLNGLTAGGSDLTKQYDTFTKELKKTQTMAENAKKQAATAQKNREAYMATWEADQAKIVNPELKAASEARKAELQPSLDKIKGSLTSAKTTFAPFMSDLNDLSLYLGNNLTPSGLAGAAPLIQKCNEAGTKVKEDLATASTGMTELAAQISPSAVK